MRIITSYKFKKCCLSLLVSCVLMTQAWALNPFVVRSIQMRGLHRIQRSTVMSYLLIRVGQRLDSAKSAHIIRALYRTGFFHDVQLERKGNTLLINVVERPTIGLINVSGNKDIPKKSLDAVLNKVGLVRGRVFNQAILEQIKHELEEQYKGRGKYNARVDVEIKQLPRNRVGIHIKISEGKVAKVKKISFIGNHAFSSKTLSKQIFLKTAGLFSLITQDDAYSKEKLDASLKVLEMYYMDRGFIKVKIDPPQETLSPDRKKVYITIKIKEGARYTFKGYRLAGKFIVPKEKLQKHVHIKPGAVFSRSAITHSVTDIGNELGDVGYGFPNIDAQPSIDENTKQIFMTIYINPGVRVYVRRINFVGNTKTADYVLRHTVKQNEGGLLSVSKIKESERQLRILQYFKNVSVKTQKVLGTNNQVDLEYHVTEVPSTQATAAVGVGTLGLEFHAGFNQQNFFGTGRTVGLNFNARKDLRDYSFTYNNPFYYDGVGVGIHGYYRQYKPGEQGIASYSTNQFGGTVDYAFTVNDRSSVHLGYGYEHLRLSINAATPQYASFVARYGKFFDQIRLTAGWSYNSYDQFPFPEHGYHQQLSGLLGLPANDRSLKFYKLGYTGQYYYLLPYDFILSLRGGIAYGNGFGDTRGLPFFESYYAGGIGGQGQVRGYDTYSLGPKDSSARALPLGGNFLTTFSSALVLPHPLSRESFRTSVFLDAGNVYASEDIPAAFRGSKSGPMRFSAGVGLEWMSPFGLVKFSLAKPLNRQPIDDPQFFQFTISAGF